MIRNLFIILALAGSAMAQTVIRVEVGGNKNSSPFDNPTNAIRYSRTLSTTNPVTIRMGAGTFYVTSQMLLRENSTLTGEGPGATTIQGTFPLLTGAWTVPGTNSTLANYTLQDTNVGADYCAPIGSTGADPGFTNATVINVNVIGTSDGIYLNSTNLCTLTLDRSSVRTTFDATFVDLNTNSVITARRSFLETVGGQSDQARVVNAVQGTTYIDGCHLKARNTYGLGRAACVYSGDAEARIFLNGNTYDPLGLDGQRVVVTNLSGLVSGTSPQPVALLSSAAMSLNAANYAASRANTADDTVIGYTTSVLRTNTMPDIGFQHVVSVVIKTNPTTGMTFTLNGNTWIWTNATPTDYMHFIEIGATPTDSRDQLEISAANAPQIVAGYANGTTATNELLTTYPGTPAIYSVAGHWSGITTTTNSYPLSNGRIVVVADTSGNAATLNIRIVPARIDQLVQNGTSFLITNNYGSAGFCAINTNWVVLWYNNRP